MKLASFTALAALFHPSSADTILQIAQATADLSTLVTAVTSADPSVGTLLGNADATLTVFAPSNAAFGKIPTADLDALLADQAALTSVLQYHVLTSVVRSTDLTNKMYAETATGDKVFVRVGDSVMINDATVTTANVEADNGVVHIIDTVLLTPLANVAATATAAGLSTVVTAVGEADPAVNDLLTDETATLTVFAPTNAAFDKVPEADLTDLLANQAELTKVLQYHVLTSIVLSSDLTNKMYATTATGDKVFVRLGDDSVMINDATVSTADVLTSNGVVHVIDTVLLTPLANVAATATAAGLSTLVTAVGEADPAVGTLLTDETATLTVFAPTNDAFAAVPEADLTALLANQAELTKVLQYHVLTSIVLSSDLSDGQTATTAQGSDVKVSIDGAGAVKINDANVVTPDVLTSNGVVHVVDAVLMPPPAGGNGGSAIVPPAMLLSLSAVGIIGQMM